MSDPRQRLLPFVQAEPMTEPGPLDRFPPPPPRPDLNSEESRAERHAAFIESLWQRGAGRQRGPGTFVMGGRVLKAKRSIGG
jgi:hypothetical protein